MGGGRVAHLIRVGAPSLREMACALSDALVSDVPGSGVSGEHAPGITRWGCSGGQEQDSCENSILASHAPNVSHPRDDSSSLSLGSIWSVVSQVPRWRKGRRTVTQPPHAGRMASCGMFS